MPEDKTRQDKTRQDKTRQDKGIVSNLKYNNTVQSNTAFLDTLRSKLPEFFTDSGSFDMEKFREELEENNIDELSSGYQLDFIGKNYAKKQSGERPTTVIVPDKIHNDKEENKNSKNLFFTGDNLEVLRHLQQNYAKSVDFIYIDPPYNTGSDGFVYPDKFEYSDEQLMNMFNLNEDELNRLKSIQGRSNHSAWLTFMYPRLYLARKLLKDTGVIFVSIDDNEQANLKLLMDDIFGESSFITKFIWEKTQHFGRQKSNFYSNADYIFAYTKKLILDNNINEVLVEFKKEEFEDAPLYNGSNNITELTFPPGTVRIDLNDGVYKKSTNQKYNLVKPVKVENNKNRTDLVLSFKSRWSNRRVNEEIKKGTYFWVKTNAFSIRAVYAGGKEFLESPKQIIFTNKDNPGKTISRFNEKIGVSENATNSLEKLMGEKYFSYPKPVSLIKYFISLYFTKNKYPDNLVVLDFFAGSATTADAVMQLNAEDGGHRQYMMVQLDEPTKEGSVAYNAGYQSIDQISRARIEKAGQKIREENPLLTDNQDFGFKHYRVLPPKQETLEMVEYTNDMQLDMFDNMIESFSSDSLGVPGGASGFDTILQTYLASDGYPFDVPFKMVDLEGINVPYVNDSRLYIISNRWGSRNTKALVNAIGTNMITVQTVVVYGYTMEMESQRELEIALNQLETKVQLQVRY